MEQIDWDENDAPIREINLQDLEPWTEKNWDEHTVIVSIPKPFDQKTLKEN
jgi:hypothetical protein